LRRFAHRREDARMPDPTGDEVCFDGCLPDKFLARAPWINSLAMASRRQSGQRPNDD
jgi:hypothetical protein